MWISLMHAVAKSDIKCAPFSIDKIIGKRKIASSEIYWKCLETWNFSCRLAFCKMRVNKQVMQNNISLIQICIVSLKIFFAAPYEEVHEFDDILKFKCKKYHEKFLILYLRHSPWWIIKISLSSLCKCLIYFETCLICRL